MGRGANWTTDDDIQLCTAYLDVSQDPVVGKDQKMKDFWDKIMEFIKKDNARKNNGQVGKDNGRTIRSCQSRRALINTTVLKFVGVLSLQQQYAPSGTNDNDVERATCEQYRNAEPGNKSFEFRACWQVLNKANKWQTPSREAPVTEQVDLPVEHPGTPTFSVPNQQANSRPIGCKRAKRDLQGGRDLKEQLATVHFTNALAKKRARILQQQVALGYFKVDLNQVPSERRERFIRTRTKLMNALDEDEADEIEAVGYQPPTDENPDQDSSGNISSGFADIPLGSVHGGYDDQQNARDQGQQYSAAYEHVEEFRPNDIPRQAPHYGPGPVQYQNLDDFDLRIGI